jgi:two-component system, cell cycle response regulator
VLFRSLLGRGHEADLVLTDPRVSSRHCRLEDRGDGFAVVELGSTNGTRVNGEAVQGERALRSGDKLEIGDTVIRFELQDAVDRAYDEVVQRLIDVDDLTGLYQRRRFDRELAALLQRARAASEPLGLLVMDLDGLKAINDAHGHLFGAYVIAESGRAIGEALPEGAIAARFGGDEYVVACPGEGREGAAEVARAIHHAVNARHYEKDGVRLRPGVSIGVAAFPADAPDAERLFVCADRAMYAAKRRGKNRVCVCGAGG